MWVDEIFWWSGVVTWIVFASVGLLIVSDWALDKVLRSLDLKYAFLEWVWNRAKRRHRAD